MPNEMEINIYRPQTKLRKGNVFTSVCQELCPQVGGGRCTPPGQTDIHHPHLGRPSRQTPSWADTHSRQTSSLVRHPPPPGQTLSTSWTDTQWADIPQWADTPPWANTPPPIRRPLQRTVRILLECILVYL